MTAAPDHNVVTPLVGKPSFSYVSVDPATAVRWLSRNTVNRNVRLTKVNQYARDMKAGRWTLSNDVICFGIDGRLLNGQHRLQAVIKADCTVLMGIMRNVPAEAMDNMDTGAARTTADVLRFGGTKNAHLVASTAKQAVLLESDRIYMDSKQQSTSTAEIQDYLDSNPGLMVSVDAAQSVRAAIDAPPTTLALAHWIISRRVGTELATLWLRQLATRAGEPDGSAVHAVASRLREIRNNRQHLATRVYVYLLVKGWNRYAAGQSVKTLTIKSSGTFRIPEPARWSRS